MPTLPIVLLIDDDKDERQSIAIALKNVFKKNANSVVFAAGKGDRDKTFESLLLSDLSKDIEDIRLILCDQDLSTMDGYRGLSAETVTTVARDEGLAIAIYGRGKTDAMADRVRQKRNFLERRFFLEFGDKYDLEQFSKNAFGLFSGCKEIFEFVRSTVFHNFQKHKTPANGSPVSLMTSLLGRQEIKTRLALYGAGDQQYLETLVTINALEEPKKACRIISSELAYWLWESVLRYPGILLNGISAASFLNINPDDFDRTDVQKLFSGAQYRGPFSNVGRWWWRDDLQAFLDKTSVADGLALAKQMGILKVRRCSCSVDRKKAAGAYCMLSNTPVSVENSVGKIPYFPAGADLARISKTEFEKVAPWAGIDS